MDGRQELDEQLRLVEASCLAYDGGNRNEAATLAAGLRRIFHSSAAAPSLPARLKSPFVELVTTAAKKPARITDGCWPALVRADLDMGRMVFVCRPILDGTKSSRRAVAFPYWWESEPVYEFGHKKVRRRDVVLALSEAADPAATAARLGLVGGSGWKMTIAPDNAPPRQVVVEDGIAATIRQIAHETLNSPALSKLAGR